MKALKIILIIIGLLITVLFIVPLFTPATAEVSAETEIALEASKVFSPVASYKDRNVWDPWVASDSTTDVTIESKPDFVGSTYAWKGEKLGTGRMEVISVTENEYIKSSLWFGEVAEPSLVEWTFEPLESGTHVVWSFSQKTKYPIGRFGMIFGKKFLKQSFETGLVNLKEHLESMPQPVSSLGQITIETQKAFEAMVANGAGTMENIGEQLGILYGMIMMELSKQDLQVSGAPFVHYLDYNEATGHSNYVAGIPVLKTGNTSGQVHSRSYDEMKVVQAMHTGPYEEFTISYGILDQYIQSKSLDLTGEAFEFYLTDPGTEPDQSKWQTIIAFPFNKDGLTVQ